MSSWRSLILNERGVALPLALICLVALTVMVLTFLTLSGVEPQISQNLTETARARYLAESGIEWAFKQVVARAAGAAAGSFEPGLFAGPDNVQNTADDQQPTNVTGQNHAAMLTTMGSPSPLPTKTTAEGTYSVTVRNDNLAGDDKFNGAGAVDGGNKFTDTNGIVIVTSTGTYRGATRTIQVALKRIGIPPFPGAVNIPGYQADSFMNNNINAGNANRYDIDGHDYDRNGTRNTSNPNKLGIQVQPGVQADLGITYEERAEQPFNNANVCTGDDCSAATKAANQAARLGIVKGKHQSTGAANTTGLNTIGPDGSLTPSVMNTFLQQIASNPATQILQSTQACPIVMTGGTSTATSTPTLTNSCSMNQTVNLGTTSDPKMVYFRGDPDTSSAFAGLTLNNMVTGAGILIIEDGDFQQYGNLRWDGIVIVTGQYVSVAFRSGSNTIIYGALTGMGSQPTESSGLFDFFIDQNLDLRIRSSKQNLDMVQQMLAVHKIISWREN
jgi:Tfp pilus assembly protein PilX